MKISVRNVDKQLFKELKLRAQREEKTAGQALNEALRLYLQQDRKSRKPLSKLPSFDFGSGTERLSEEIDEVLYGSRST